MTTRRTTSRKKVVPAEPLAEGRLRMREVEVRTGLPRSTVHLYVRQGLLPQPTRTRRNQAFYDEEFVRRAKLVKALQSKARMPLSSIRKALQKVPQGAARAIDPEHVVDVARRISDTLELAWDADVEKRELLRTTPIRARDLAALEAAGLIEGRKLGGQIVYAPADARIALAYARIAEFYRAAAPNTAEDEYLPSQSLLRAYGKRLAELARAETQELVRTAELLAVVESGGFTSRMSGAVGELILAIHRRQFLKELASLKPLSASRRLRSP